jgi:hypothetical protein
MPASRPPRHRDGASKARTRSREEDENPTCRNNSGRPYRDVNDQGLSTSVGANRHVDANRRRTPFQWPTSVDRRCQRRSRRRDTLIGVVPRRGPTSRSAAADVCRRRPKRFAGAEAQRQYSFSDGSRAAGWTSSSIHGVRSRTSGWARILTRSAREPDYYWAPQGSCHHVSVTKGVRTFRRASLSRVSTTADSRRPPFVSRPARASLPEAR